MRVVGPATQRIAHIEIVNPRCVQGGGERLSGELWLIARIGRRADIDQISDPMMAEQGDQFLDGAAAVANGVNRRRPLVWLRHHEPHRLHYHSRPGLAIRRMVGLRYYICMIVPYSFCSRLMIRLQHAIEHSGKATI